MAYEPELYFFIHGVISGCRVLFLKESSKGEEIPSVQCPDGEVI